MVKLRFGIIGCGMINQIQHIPNIWELPDAEIVAVCDIQEDLAKRIAKRYQIPNVYTDYHKLIAREDVDAALMALPPQYNAIVAIDTLKAGKPLLLEKPISITVKDAEKIVEAATENNTILQIAYNRRYDATYELALEKFRGSKRPFLIRAVNFDHAAYLDEIYHVYGERQTGAPSKEMEGQLTEQLGARATELERRAYWWLVFGTVHIFNATRGVFGDPKRVIKTDIWRTMTVSPPYYPTAYEFPSLLSILDYGEETRVVVEQGANRTRRMVEFIEAWSTEGMVKLSYDDPYLQNSLTTLEILKGDGVEREENKVVASRKTNHKLELRHFIECVEKKKTPRTPGEDALTDMKIFAAIIESYFRGEAITL